MKKRKNQDNYFVVLLTEICVFAAEILAAAGLIVGFLYGVSFIAEILSSFVTVEMGLFVFFTIAGLALYIDFRPEKRRRESRRGRCHSRPAVGSASGRMLKVYSAK